MLRSYLSFALNCAPMRITKKFCGESCVGKRVFQPLEDSPSNRTFIVARQAELRALRRLWIEKLLFIERESTRKCCLKGVGAVNYRHHFSASSSCCQEESDFDTLSAGLLGLDKIRHSLRTFLKVQEDGRDNIEDVFSWLSNSEKLLDNMSSSDDVSVALSKLDNMVLLGEKAVTELHKRISVAFQQKENDDFSSDNCSNSTRSKTNVVCKLTVDVNAKYECPRSILPNRIPSLSLPSPSESTLISPLSSLSSLSPLSSLDSNSPRSDWDSCSPAKESILGKRTSRVFFPPNDEFSLSSLIESIKPSKASEDDAYSQKHVPCSSETSSNNLLFARNNINYETESPDSCENIPRKRFRDLVDDNTNFVRELERNRVCILQDSFGAASNSIPNERSSRHLWNNNCDNSDSSCLYSDTRWSAQNFFSSSRNSGQHQRGVNQNSDNIMASLMMYRNVLASYPTYSRNDYSPPRSYYRHPMSNVMQPDAHFQATLYNQMLQQQDFSRRMTMLHQDSRMCTGLPNPFFSNTHWSNRDPRSNSFLSSSSNSSNFLTIPLPSNAQSIAKTPSLQKGSTGNSIDSAVDALLGLVNM